MRDVDFTAELEAPLDPRVHDRRWLILGVLCMSLLIIVMDNTILNVAIPSMMTELGATNSQIQWIIDSYVLVFAGLLLTTGSISDRFGRKGALQAGIVLFGIGSVLAANATTANQLIAFRAFMGIGGALIMPATLSILTNVFRDPKERGRAIGVWAGFSGLGVAMGPITGGFLLEHFDWSSVFWVNLPIGLTALLLGALLVPTSRDPRQTRLDPVGALLSIVGLAALLFGIIEGEPKGWGSAEVLTGFAVAIVAIGGFVAWELRCDHPMLDLTVFRNARFSAASGTITIVFFALMGSMFLMTQYWQLVHGYSPLDAGVRLLPAAALMMLAAPQSARLVEHFGTKRVVLAGLTLIALGMLLTSFIEAETPYWNVMARFMVMYLGMSMTMAPATESVMGSLPREKAGVGSAINDTTRQVGGALGVAIIGSVVSGHWSTGIAKAARAAGLDEASTANAEESLSRAMSEASALGDRAGAFITEAKHTFVDAMTMGMRVSFVIVLLAAAVAWKFLPHRAADGEPLGDAAPADAAAAFEELAVAAGE
ncbi:MAG TPA: MFS transporter [Ilumatobacter sp.]|nr:MFS transporter [Ilumatobacter sp.]